MAMCGRRQSSGQHAGRRKMGHRPGAWASLEAGRGRTQPLGVPAERAQACRHLGFSPVHTLWTSDLQNYCDHKAVSLSFSHALQQQ